MHQRPGTPPEQPQASPVPQLAAGTVLAAGGSGNFRGGGMQQSPPDEQHSSAMLPSFKASTTVASMLPVWFSPGHVWAGRSVDVCCGLVGVAGGVGARVGGAQGADWTCVRPG